jgi:large subunit ribosomal protein L22
MRIKNNITIESTNILKSSVDKLNLVANIIRSKNVNYAKFQLKFCNKIAAFYIKPVLMSAISYAKNNFGLNIRKLFIKEIKVSKSSFLKRSKIRARGKIDKILKPFSKVTIILSIDK